MSLVAIENVSRETPMLKLNARFLKSCCALVTAAIATGCSPSGRSTVEASHKTLRTTNGIFQNGIFQNGLTTNGIFQNGIFQNGIFQNGIFQNGIFQNGIFQNGIFQNGIFQNGIFQNGIFQNGIFQNGVWENGIFQNGIWQSGLSGDAAYLGNMLRSSSYARQLLQYIYSCAMPATTYDTTLDPDAGSCTPGGDVATECGADYACVDSRCVVPLTGSVGVGVNADGTTWGESGTCDESCQRRPRADLDARAGERPARPRAAVRQDSCRAGDHG